jgi:hypothetical protein
LHSKVNVKVDAGRRDKEANQARWHHRRTCMASPRPVKDMPHQSDRQGHPCTQAKRKALAVNGQPDTVPKLAQPLSSLECHGLQGTSRSLLLEGKVRLNIIKHPNQLVALRCAADPTPRSQPQCALHALRRARLRSSGPWTARSNQPKAASDDDDPKLHDTLFSPIRRVGHRATLLRHGKPLCPR